MEPTIQSFLPLMSGSRLFSPDQVTALYARWAQTPGSSSTDFPKFSRWLVSEKLLTDYQIAVLVRGHAAALFLDEYKLLDRLGQGDTAGVYKAAHELGQVVAIKVLPPSKAKDPQQFGRFQREARLAVRLKHPNVVRTFQKGEANGVHYLVMEYLEGETLQAVMKRRGPLPGVEAVRLLYQALQGLQHLHEHGMVHRDLQPANLMLVPPLPPGQPDTTLHATVKIVDVGVARVLFDDAPPGEMGGAGLTVQGDMLGLPAYIAPEQVRDARRADIRSDIYSMGCILFEALAGKKPFAGLPLTALGRPAPDRPIPSLRGLNPQVSAELQQVVETMLAVDPARRPATPEDAAQALKPFLTAKTNVAPVGELPTHTKAYLQWVEARLAKEEPVDYDLTQPAAPAAPSAPAPSAKAAAAPPPRQAAAPQPTATPAKAPPAGQRAETPRRQGGTILGLSVRDWMMLASGMAIGIVVTLLLAKFVPMLAEKLGQ